MAPDDRLLLFTNDVSLGLFPRDALCLVLSPDGASLTAVRGETVRCCLTRFCPTALAACVARLLAFRNVHAAAPYLCERFLPSDVPRWRAEKGVAKPPAVPTVSWCPLRRRVCVQTAADVLAADPMVEMRHGRAHTLAAVTRVLPAGAPPYVATTTTAAAEGTKAFAEDLLPELLGLLRDADQYPSSAVHAVRVQAVGGATLTAVVGAASDGGKHLAVEAWFHDAASSSLPLGPTLTLEREFFKYRWEGEEDRGGRFLEIHVGLLDGLFSVDGEAVVDSGEEDGAAIDALSVLRQHRGAALRLLQYREYLERRRRCLAPPPPSDCAASSSSAAVGGGTYYLIEGQLVQKKQPLQQPGAGGDRWDRTTPTGGDDDGIVTLVLPSGTTFRAFPALADRTEPFGRLRGVFPDRTQATVHLEADPAQGAAARTARLLLPDGSEAVAPLAAFSADGDSATATGPLRQKAAYVTALLSFHRWACAPPARRAALMERMQGVASMGAAADARSRHHLAVEKLRSGSGEGDRRRPAAPAAPTAPAAEVENAAPPLPRLSAATCAFRVRDALRASQQALRDNARLLNKQET